MDVNFLRVWPSNRVCRGYIVADDPGKVKLDSMSSLTQPPKGPLGADRLKIEAVRSRGTSNQLSGGSPNQQIPLPITVGKPVPHTGPIVEIDPCVPDESAAVLAVAVAAHLQIHGITVKGTGVFAGSEAEVRRVLRGTASVSSAIAIACALGITVEIISPCGCFGRTKAV